MSEAVLQELMIDCAAEPPPLAARLRQTLLKDGLALARGNQLSRSEVIDLCRHFGTAEKRDTPFFPDYPEIYPVSHDKRLGHVDIGQYWHADGAWYLTPVRFSLLYAADGNFLDNTTCFVRTDRVFQRMHEALKSVARRIVLKHPNGAVQPIVRRDAGGTEYLHFNAGLLTRYLRKVSEGGDSGQRAGLDVAITGAEPAELSRVLEALIEALDAAPELYRHQWQPGDLLAVDNLKFMHRAQPYGEQTTRLLYRVCVFE